MPPRLVAFVYLQDVPTHSHAPTVFLPGKAVAGKERVGQLEDGGIAAGMHRNEWWSVCQVLLMLPHTMQYSTVEGQS